jgi:hypothetical protein
MDGLANSDCYVPDVLQAGIGCAVEEETSRDSNLEVGTMARVHAHSTSYFRKAHARLKRAKWRLAAVSWQVRYRFEGNMGGEGDGYQRLLKLVATDVGVRENCLRGIMI